jgi:hypothetical protein
LSAFNDEACVILINPPFVAPLKLTAPPFATDADALNVTVVPLTADTVVPVAIPEPLTAIPGTIPAADVTERVVLELDSAAAVVLAVLVTVTALAAVTRALLIADVFSRVAAASERL